jgi:hypothetical protein
MWKKLVVERPDSGETGGSCGRKTESALKMEFSGVGMMRRERVEEEELVRARSWGASFWALELRLHPGLRSMTTKISVPR